MNQDNIIELNGKRYDAFSGKLLGRSTADVRPFARPGAPLPGRGRSIDGIGRRPTDAPAQSRPAIPAPQLVGPATAESALVKHEARTHTPHSVKAHHPKHAQTLMRRAVHKPKTAVKPHIKTQMTAELAAVPISTIATKRSVQSVDPLRKQRAQATPKHQQVARFPKRQNTTPSTPVSPEPSRAALAPVVASAPPPITLPVGISTSPRHGRPDAVRSLTRPQPMHVHATGPHPVAVQGDIFEAAIARATSHEQPPHHVKKHRSRKHRLASTFAAVGALLVVGGLLAFLNINRIQLQAASFRAGFSASMPSFAPTGFQLTKVSEERGSVALEYRSGSANYRITQQDSNWNSQTLGDSIAVPGHTTIESKGRLIHIYDGQASWVNGGVRYDIISNAELSPDELVAIATSL